jgi:hypothetical protein
MGRGNTTPRRGARALIVLASTALGLLLAELGAGAQRDHAYSFLNVFVSDERFGVLLEPGAETRTRSREGHVTRVAVNRAGFRGPAWRAAPDEAPVPGRVMIVGDSQVFGYGVAWEESLAAVMTGRGVEALAAAVPSWGPPEYVRAIEALAPVYRPSHVVFVANAANDWSEVGVPNARRTTARDGWLVQRTEAVEDAPVGFPGRRLLMQRSHLILLGRRLAAHARDGALPVADAATRLLREAARPAVGPHRSRMTPALLAAERACRPLGCRVVAAALPLDVQVHPGEWAKYRGGARSLEAARPLLDDFVADAREAGIPAVDLLDALAEASPGAFLPDDYHLSPKGHRAVARALAPLLEASAATAALAAEETR